MTLVSASLRDAPFYRLTRHFFAGLFDLGFLSEAGIESFWRMLVGIGAVFLSFGLLVVRIFLGNFDKMAALDSPEPYRWGSFAGEMFASAVPMWIVAFVTVLVSHSLFPDETDFRALVPLPLQQRFIFGSKLLALVLFTGAFTLAAHAAMAPLVLVMSLGSGARHVWVLRLFAFEVSSLAGSACAVLIVTAVNGLLLMFAPRRRMLTMSTVLRSAMLCALVLALPLVARLPAQATNLAHGATILYLAPPAWFLGIERVLLGEPDPYLVRLAAIGAGSFGLAALIASGSYLVLYHRFDRVMPGPSDGPSKRPGRIRARRWLRRRNDAALAIRTFTMITLRRSGLHQGIVVCLSAAGVGFVLNGLISADVLGWLQRGGEPPRALVGWVVWTPFALMFCAILAVRAALVVPIEPRANWIFRMTDPQEARRDPLSAAISTVRRLGVLVPLALVLPLQWAVYGAVVVRALAAEAIAGVLLVEIAMSRWSRIPFTCSYLPGKGFIPQTILRGFVAFVLFTTIGSGLVLLSLSGRPAALVPNTLLVAETLWLRRRRLRHWIETPIAFEDELPTDVYLLGLSAD